MVRLAWLVGVMTVVLAGGLIHPAAAQGRPSAMTCDYYKKQLSYEITKSRRADQAARREAESARIAQGTAQTYDNPYTRPDETDPGPPERDYGQIDQLRREAEMLCAQRKYDAGVGAYKKAMGLLGIQIRD